MELVFYILLGIIGFCLISILYFSYQGQRNHKVYEIRVKWIYDNDKRFEQYTYDEMYDPHLSNWFGLKFPKEKHYKLKEKE